MPRTERPPIRMSPPVGCSRPAIMRSSVVLPQPDGPSRTRYSPSRQTRLMPSTAAVAPPNDFRTSRTSTSAIQALLRAADQPLAAPALEDRLDLLLGVGHRLFGLALAAGGRRHHGGQDVLVENLADRGARRTRGADIAASCCCVVHKLWLFGRVRLERVAVQPAPRREQAVLGLGAGIDRELIELRLIGDVVHVVDEVEQELLGDVLVFGKFRRSEETT